MCRRELFTIKNRTKTCVRISTHRERAIPVATGNTLLCGQILGPFGEIDMSAVNKK